MHDTLTVDLDGRSLTIETGKIAKQSPEAMKVRTPATVLGVRGTEFVVFVDG